MATKKIDNDFSGMSVADMMAMMSQLKAKIDESKTAERNKFYDILKEVKGQNEQALLRVREENQKRLDDLRAEAEAAGITDLFQDDQPHENGKYYLVNPANPAEKWGRSGRKPPWLIALIAAGAAEEPPKTEQEVKDGLKKEWVPF